MSTNIAQIYEMDSERDRKTCLSLDLKVTGANCELAQWLMDHPRYSAPVVAEWLGCGETRIKQLRAWARKGFLGAYTDANRIKHGYRRRHDADAPLLSQDNSEDGADIERSEVAEPAQIEDNLHHYLGRMNHFAVVFKKLFRASTFDREAEFRMVTAIDRTIEKWRSTQATLTKKGRR